VRSLHAFAAIVLGALTMAPLPPTPTRTSRPATLDDFRAGLAAYRSGQLEVACSLFERVVNRQPRNGAAWADLGLCERRRGNSRRAIQASIRAVRHGARRIRLNASYNLWQLGVTARLPEKAGQCSELRAPVGLGCSSALNVCRGEEEHGGNGGGVVYQYVEVLPAGKKPAQNEPGLVVPIRGDAWATTKGCDYAWSLRTPLFERLTRGCIGRGRDELTCDHATRTVLSSATGTTGQPASPESAALVPLATTDRRRARRDAADCLQRHRQELAARSGPICSLVLADPCRGTVHVVCDGPALDEFNRNAELPSPPGHVAKELSLELNQ
jgi:hypothetical protein